MSATWFANYSFGPVSVGYRISEIQAGSAGTAGKNVEAYAIAFNVNDNLSISYAEYESEEVLGTTGGQTQKADSIQLTYNMGGATLKFAETNADDARYSAGISNEATTVALGLAF